MNLDLSSCELDRGIHRSGKELLDERYGLAVTFFACASPVSCPKSASASPFVCSALHEIAFSTKRQICHTSGRSIICFAVLDLTS
jgi:hypothetical protein